MTAADFLPQRRTLTALRQAAATCRGCSLYRNATQTVFGEGRTSAEVVMVGEQPGDQEDRRGKPFVGPAGRILDQALEDAGIDRADVYITNVVKHFKFQPRGSAGSTSGPRRPRRRRAALGSTPSSRRSSRRRCWRWGPRRRRTYSADRSE